MKTLEDLNTLEKQIYSYVLMACDECLKGLTASEAAEITYMGKEDALFILNQIMSYGLIDERLIMRGDRVVRVFEAV